MWRGRRRKRWSDSIGCLTQGQADAASKVPPLQELASEARRPLFSARSVAAPGPPANPRYGSVNVRPRSAAGGTTKRRSCRRQRPQRPLHVPVEDSEIKSHAGMRHGSPTGNPRTPGTGPWRPWVASGDRDVPATQGQRSPAAPVLPPSEAGTKPPQLHGGETRHAGQAASLHAPPPEPPVPPRFRSIAATHCEYGIVADASV